jgi:hypothetical protein
MIVTTDQYNAMLAHAKANYEKDGWDYFVECFDLASLQDASDRCRCASFEELFREIARLCAMWREYETETGINAFRMRDEY